MATCQGQSVVGFRDGDRPEAAGGRWDHRRRGAPHETGDRRRRQGYSASRSNGSGSSRFFANSGREPATSPMSHHEMNRVVNVSRRFGGEERSGHLARPSRQATSNRSSMGVCTLSRDRAPATMNDEGLADAAPANPCRLSRLHSGSCVHRHYLRSDLKPARISSLRNFGCSQAAKWPPLGSLL